MPADQPQPLGPWSPELCALRGRIEAHAFDGEDPLSFTRRLARDHRWALAFAKGAVREYGRFCFLAVACAGAVTPSEEVDEVWHLHLTYSRDYWAVWCRDVLQAELHHDPTKGGLEEQNRFRDQYARTLAAYDAFFGAPPAMFWPATHRRFASRPRFGVLDTHRSMTVPRLTWRQS